jgi:hypothetical protein
LWGDGTTDRGGRGGRLGLVACDHQNGGPFSGRQPGDLKANAFASAGDEVILGHEVSLMLK